MIVRAWVIVHVCLAAAVCFSCISFAVPILLSVRDAEQATL